MSEIIPATNPAKAVCLRDLLGTLLADDVMSVGYPHDDQYYVVSRPLISRSAFAQVLGCSFDDLGRKRVNNLGQTCSIVLIPAPIGDKALEKNATRLSKLYFLRERLGGAERRSESGDFNGGLSRLGVADIKCDYKEEIASESSGRRVVPITTGANFCGFEMLVHLTRLQREHRQFNQIIPHIAHTLGCKPQLEFFSVPPSFKQSPDYQIISIADAAVDQALATQAIEGTEKYTWRRIAAALLYNQAPRLPRVFALIQGLGRKVVFPRIFP